jgi:hypothetical protein
MGVGTGRRDYEQAQPAGFPYFGSMVRRANDPSMFRVFRSEEAWEKKEIVCISIN